MEKTYFRNFVKHMYEYVDNLIQQDMITDMHIVLFGLNSSSYVIRDYLVKKGLSVTAYIDNDVRKRTNWTGEIPACSPEEMRERYGENVAILITSKYYLEMKKQLEELGYCENVHIFQVVNVRDLEQYVDFSDAEGMEEIGIEELKIIQMALLRYMKEICENNHLRYYLCGGSLIGAIRHGGYIPWDDDIDVVMPMKDYRELIRIVNEREDDFKVLNVYEHQGIFHSFYSRLVYPGTLMKTWDYPYMESVGVNIDIFPLYGVPEGEEAAEEWADRMEALHVNCMEEFIKYEEPSEGFFTFQNQILSMMDEYAFDESTNVAYLLSRHKKKEIMPRSIYRKSVMVEFEGEMYPIPYGYDAYLTRLFGDDYMELPPEKDRVSVHNYRAFVDSEAKKRLLQSE